MARGRPAELEAAAEAAAQAPEAMADLPAPERVAILGRAVHRINERRDELAQAISEEACKPTRLARSETHRCLDTFNEAARVARQPEVVAQDLTGYGSGIDREGPLCACREMTEELMLVLRR